MAECSKPSIFESVQGRGNRCFPMAPLFRINLNCYWPPLRTRTAGGGNWARITGRRLAWGYWNHWRVFYHFLTLEPAEGRWSVSSEDPFPPSSLAGRNSTPSRQTILVGNCSNLHGRVSGMGGGGFNNGCYTPVLTGSVGGTPLPGSNLKCCQLTFPGDSLSPLRRSP